MSDLLDDINMLAASAHNTPQNERRAIRLTDGIATLQAENATLREQLREGVKAVSSAYPSRMDDWLKRTDELIDPPQQEEG